MSPYRLYRPLLTNSGCWCFFLFFAPEKTWEAYDPGEFFRHLAPLAGSQRKEDLLQKDELSWKHDFFFSLTTPLLLLPCSSTSSTLVYFFFTPQRLTRRRRVAFLLRLADSRISSAREVVEVPRLFDGFPTKKKTTLGFGLWFLKS